MLFPELYKIMVNKVTFMVLGGGSSQFLPLDLPLVAMPRLQNQAAQQQSVREKSLMHAAHEKCLALLERC